MADATGWWPERDYRTSRLLRLTLFCLVVSTLLVSAFVIVFGFVWNEFVAPAFDRAPYQARIEFLVPAILLIAFVLGLRIWDSAERAMRPPAEKRP